MKFVSTRGSSPVSFGQALAQGLAPDGGLYMPQTWPVIPLTAFDGATTLPEVAEVMLRPFVDGDPIAAQIGDVVRDAASLIDKSLLLRAEGAVAARPLYEMLETVKAFAALELTAAGERDDAMEGLAQYCVTEASRSAKGLIGPAQGEWLDRVRDDLESHRSALTWLIARGRSTEATDIACGLKYFWLIRGHAAEGLQWYEQILKVPSLPAAAESRALLAAAGMWWTQGGLERARAGVDRVLALAYDVGDMETVAQAEHISGHVEHALGNVDVARERFARAIELFRTLAPAVALIGGPALGDAHRDAAKRFAGTFVGADFEHVLSRALRHERDPLRPLRAVDAVGLGDQLAAGGVEPQDRVHLVLLDAQQQEQRARAGAVGERLENGGGIGTPAPWTQGTQFS